MLHELSVKLPKAAIGISDIEILVKGDDEIIGKLAISKGAIEWKPKGGKKPYKMSWEKFSKIMQENGNRR